MHYFKSLIPMFLVAVVWAMPAHAIPESFADLAAEQADAVVNISTTQHVVQRGQQGLPPGFGFPPGSPFEDFFQDFLRNMPQQQQEKHSLGTGFVISADGYVVTNNHVVDGADEVVVKFNDGSELEAKIIGTDPKLDVALLKVKGKKLKTVNVGNSDGLRVGDWVVAIGNPFGLGQTVTAGIVSAKGRVIGSGPYDDFIQTDAAINPGNSGGPLFNIKGEVVGINTAIYSRSGGNNGIGFAIPMNLARPVLDELKEKGHVTRARLGVHITDVNKETMQALGLKNREGALVPQVEAGSAADKAGIRAGDVIVSIDGEAIHKAHDLPIRVARHAPGDKVKLGIIRDGKLINLTATVEAMPDEQVASNGQQKQENSKVRLGVVAENLTPDLGARLRTRVKKGVVVQQVQQGMPAANAGIQRGDVIYRINGKDVNDMQAFAKLADTFKHGEVLRVMMDRNGDQVFALVKLPKKSGD
ncbi:serine protease Do [Mariprofundus ferrinatatus]|uniref:Probable periplasmic serine endoprotease DegP-like n=1 Tax=Mariprofundus ferrinatatus TaxID=1921087 RepID=A0A2K8L1F4_9PROT|nr:DegQ family serine endoprotease [Mariprofundus ferrinatatus]ATX81117.1 serine protease Do [Mariprofundus ferrinatatus]